MRDACELVPATPNEAAVWPSGGSGKLGACQEGPELRKVGDWRGVSLGENSVKIQTARTQAILQPSWERAALAPARPLALIMEAPARAVFEPLPGWKAPLWRSMEGALEFLRPEGLWRADASNLPRRLFLHQRGASGWCSGRGMSIDLAVRPGVWFDQHGIAQRPEGLDQEASPPSELGGEAHASGAFARWELTEDGRAIGWLDDSFEKGPFSARVRTPRLLVSDGTRKVAYWLGESHWAWAFVAKGKFSLLTGRGGGWEPERDYQPVVI